MTYYIMIQKSKRANYESLYQYYTIEHTLEDGTTEIIPYSTSVITDLENTINTLLEIYTKDKILVITKLDFDTVVDVTE